MLSKARILRLGIPYVAHFERYRDEIIEVVSKTINEIPDEAMDSVEYIMTPVVSYDMDTANIESRTQFYAVKYNIKTGLFVGLEAKLPDRMGNTELCTIPLPKHLQ